MRVSTTTPDYGSYRPITVDEWNEHEWAEVTSLSDMGEGRRVYIQGKHKTDPPVDGYEYRRCDLAFDNEYKWERLIPESELAK